MCSEPNRPAGSLSRSSRLSIRYVGVVLFCLAFSSLVRNEALHLLIDYSYDTSGFFSQAERRVAMERAAEVFQSRVETVLDAIIPTRTNLWTLGFTNPAVGVKVVLTNLTLPVDTVKIFVGARDLGLNRLGYADFSYTFNGDANWNRSFRRRINSTNYQTLGGGIAFNSGQTWYFETNYVSLGKISTNQYDFYSVAVHELGHLMGILKTGIEGHVIDDTYFSGPATTSLFGGPVPLTSDLTHVQTNTVFKGNTMIMVPLIPKGTRRIFTEVEFAMLSDMGYSITAPPQLVIVNMLHSELSTTVEWEGGVGPFRIERSSNLSVWSPSSATTRSRRFTVSTSGPLDFFRIIDTGQ
jgi:hypothetical protein